MLINRAQSSLRSMKMLISKNSKKCQKHALRTIKTPFLTKNDKFWEKNPKNKIDV